MGKLSEISRYWCMRLEGKHRMAKLVAHVSCKLFMPFDFGAGSCYNLLLLCYILVNDFLNHLCMDTGRCLFCFILVLQISHVNLMVNAIKSIFRLIKLN